MSQFIALSLALLSAAAVASPRRDGPQQLTADGKLLTGEITAEDAGVHTPQLEGGTTYDPPARGDAFLVEVEVAGTYTIELRSPIFNAYLVLRDAEGVVVAEDDNGLGAAMNARIVASLEAGTTYRLDACAREIITGPYELRMIAGSPPVLTHQQEMERDMSDLERRIAALEEADVPLYLAEALSNYANALHNLSRWEEALRFWQRSLEIYEVELGPESEEVIALLGNLGAASYQKGDPQAATEFMGRSLGLYEELLGPQARQTIMARYQLAAARRLAGDLLEARRLLERAVADGEEVFGPDHEDLGPMFNLLAAVAEALAEHREAKRLYLRALSIQEGQPNPDRLQLNVTRNNYAQLLLSLGESYEALQQLEDFVVWAEAELGPRHEFTVNGLNNLAIVRYQVGDKNGAATLLEKVVAIREGSRSGQYANNLQNLALIRGELGEKDAALALYQDAVAMWTEALGETHPRTLRARFDLADAHAELRHTAEARAGYDEVLAALDPRTQPQLISRIKVLKARHEHSLGEHEAALALMDEGLPWIEALLSPKHITCLIERVYRGVILLDLHRDEEAWDQSLRSIEALEEHIDRSLPRLSEIDAFFRLEQLRYVLESHLGTALLADDPAKSVQAYEGLVHWKGRLGRALLERRIRASSEATELVERIQEIQSQLSRAAFDDNALADAFTAPPNIAALRDERIRLERELADRLGARPAPPAVRHADLRAALPPNSAFVDLFVHRPLHRALYDENGKLVHQGAFNVRHLSAWITRPDREGVEHVYLCLLDALEPFLESVQRTLAPARGVPVAATGNETLEAASPLLWAPIEEALEGVDTVFISPDGVVGTVPFETLRDADGRYLIETRSFVYVGDPYSFVTDKRPPQALDSMLTVGNVDFGASEEPPLREDATPVRLAQAASPDVGRLLRARSAAAWSALPGTGSEARAIDTTYRQAYPAQRSLLLTGAEVSEERLKRELPKHRVAHLATHGFYHPDRLPFFEDEEAGRLLELNPGLRAGLVCSGVNSARLPEQDDGYLTAEEVAWLDLSDVELVVLSACETGVGRPRSGEGLVGVRRAFRLAGAKTVIASLWPVEDASTSVLMQKVYENLFVHDMGRHEALRVAQLFMLRSNREKYNEARPDTWGAFVLTGEWR